jgi:hypothetical protein
MNRSIITSAIGAVSRHLSVSCVIGRTGMRFDRAVRRAIGAAVAIRHPTLVAATQHDQWRPVRSARQGQLPLGRTALEKTQPRVPRPVQRAVRISTAVHCLLGERRS